MVFILSVTQHLVAGKCILDVYVHIMIPTDHDVLCLGVPSASLTTTPAPLNGSICPTTVRITCIISDLSSLRWFIDDMLLDP